MSGAQTAAPKWTSPENGTNIMLAVRQVDVPENGDAIDIQHPVYGRHEVEVDSLGGGPQYPVKLKIFSPLIT